MQNLVYHPERKFLLTQSFDKHKMRAGRSRPQDDEYDNDGDHGHDGDLAGDDGLFGRGLEEKAGNSKRLSLPHDSIHDKKAWALY